MSQAAGFITNSGPGGFVQTLTGNSGPAVPPLAGNINVVGDGTTITTVGNAGTHTLTISATGAVAISFPTDSGTATPSAGVLNIIAGISSKNCGATVEFTGSGNTVELHLTSNDVAENTLLGQLCGQFLTSGTCNTGLGASALNSNPSGISGSFNTAVGFEAGFDITAGMANTALGAQSLQNGHPGNYNISIGFESATNFTGGEDSNIIIGNPGVASESNVIRLGTTGGSSQQQNKCFIAGIDGVNLATANVVVEASDQLGTAVLTAGTGISITPGTNTITIAATGAGFTWHDVTGGSATLAAENGYIADAAGLTTFTLPTNNAIGDTIKIVGKGAGGWKIVYGAGQNIIFGSSASTVTTGNIASTNANDCAELVCTTASATAPIFTIVNAVGNLSIT